MSEQNAETASSDVGVSSETVDVKNEVPSYVGTKHRVVIDENEQEIDYDELVKGYQKGNVSAKRFREAAEMRKQIDEVIETIKNGTHKDLVKLVGEEKAIQLSQDLLLEKIEYDDLPESEKTIKTLQREKDEVEKKLQARESEEQTYKRQKMEAEVAEEIQTEIITAIENTKTKPTRRLIGNVAEILQAHILGTGQRMEAKDALKIVKGEIPKDFAALVENATPEEMIALKKLLPKKFLDALRNDDIETVLSQNPLGKGRTNYDDLPKSKGQKKAGTLDDWFENTTKKYGRTR